MAAMNVTELERAKWASVDEPAETFTCNQNANFMDIVYFIARPKSSLFRLNQFQNLINEAGA